MIKRMQENIWSQWSSSSKNGDNEVTTGEQNKDKTDVCVPRFPSKLTNTAMSASAVTAAVAASSPAQTCARRPVPENKSCDTKRESGLMEESSFQ